MTPPRALPTRRAAAAPLCRHNRPFWLTPPYPIVAQDLDPFKIHHMTPCPTSDTPRSTLETQHQ